MRRLIYISQATTGIDDQAIDAIVTASRAHNAAVGVTGMLWSDGTRFVQVLEGEAPALDATMERIRADPRHDAIEIVADRAATHRLFGQWGMVRPDTGAEATANTAFLIGMALNDRSPAARRMYDILIGSDGFERTAPTPAA